MKGFNFFFFFFQNCSVLSSSTITCLSPESSQSQETSVQFVLNGVPYTGDSPSSSDDRPGEPHKEHFQLGYVEDPQFFTTNKDKQIKHHSGEPLTLIINVSNEAETECASLLCSGVIYLMLTKFYHNYISFVFPIICSNSALTGCILSNF